MTGARFAVMVCGGSLMIGSLTGCANDRSHDEATTASAFFEEYVDMARTQGASDEQLAVLESGISRGGISREDVLPQLEKFALCIETAGGVYFPEPDEVIGPENYSVPVYSVGVPGMSDSEALALIEDCERVHIEFALGALWFQPVLIEARDAEFEQERPAVVSCLADHGVQVDLQATTGEVQALVGELLSETGVQCYTPSWWE